jgi:hypothetical protein
MPLHSKFRVHPVIFTRYLHDMARMVTKKKIVPKKKKPPYSA